MLPITGSNNRKQLLAELGQVLWLSFPIIITMGSHTLMQFVDTLFLAHYGVAELAASSPAGLTFFTAGSFMLGLISCNNTFVSQSLGRGQSHECVRYTVHALALGIAAQVLMIPIIIYAPALFHLYGHSAQIQPLEVSYFRALSWRIGGMSIVAAFSTFFQATDRPGLPMITGIIGNVLNVIGDYALIFGHWGFPRWGIFGAGYVTTWATWFEAVFLFIVFIHPRMQAQFRPRDWAPFEMKKIVQFLRIGVAAGLTYALDLGSWAIFIAAVVGRLGENVLAGNNAATQIMSLSFMPAIGLNIGVTALVGRHIGMGDIHGAKRRAYVSMAAAACYMTFMALLFLIFRRPLIELFSKDPEVVHAGMIILGYVALFQMADAIGILSSGALKGAGDTNFPVIAQGVLAWGFFLPVVFYLGRASVWGIHGAWLAATVYIWLYDIVLFVRFRGEKWRKIDIFR